MSIRSAALLHSQLTVFSNVTDQQHLGDRGCYDAYPNVVQLPHRLSGARYGAEYQGDLKLGAFGGLIFGARTETETASTSQSPNPNDGSFTPIRAQQTTNSVFAEHRLTLFDRLDLTLGGRIDAIEGGADLRHLARHRRLPDRRDGNQAARQRRNGRQGRDALSAASV